MWHLKTVKFYLIKLSNISTLRCNWSFSMIMNSACCVFHFGLRGPGYHSIKTNSFNFTILQSYCFNNIIIFGFKRIKTFVTDHNSRECNDLKCLHLSCIHYPHSVGISRNSDFWFEKKNTIQLLQYFKKISYTTIISP